MSRVVNKKAQFSGFVEIVKIHSYTFTLPLCFSLNPLVRLEQKTHTQSALGLSGVLAGV